jgi:regulation of enolase protein 1 (concanavalin A-like superfamily)
MIRSRVYEAIDSERDLQDRKWGTVQEHPHEVGGWLTIMRKLMADAEAAWASKSDDRPALAEIRKVIAVGVACCEQHGVSFRSKFEEPPVESMR